MPQMELWVDSVTDRGMTALRESVDIDVRRFEAFRDSWKAERSRIIWDGETGRMRCSHTWTTRWSGNVSLESRSY